MRCDALQVRVAARSSLCGAGNDHGKPNEPDADSLAQDGITKKEYKSWKKYDRRKFLEDLLTKQRRAHQAQSEDDYYKTLRNMHKVNTSDVRKLLHQKTNDTAELDAHILLSKPESLERHPIFCVLTRKDGALGDLKVAICHCK